MLSSRCQHTLQQPLDLMLSSRCQRALQQSLDHASLDETLFRDGDLWGPSFYQGTLLVPSGCREQRCMQVLLDEEHLFHENPGKQGREKAALKGRCPINRLTGIPRTPRSWLHFPAGAGYVLSPLPGDSPS